MSALDEIEDFVWEKIEMEKYMHRQLSNELQVSFLGEKEFNLWSVEKFCSDRGLRCLILVKKN